MKNKQIKSKQHNQEINVNQRWGTPVKVVSMPYDETSKKSLNVSKLALLVTFFSSCISLLMACASWQNSNNALYISEKANAIAMCPELRIEDDYITIYWDSDGKVEYLSHYLEDNITVDGTISIPGINIVNIGTGTAKNVQINWNFIENLNVLQSKLGENYKIDFNEKGDRLEISYQKLGEPQSRISESKYDFASYICTGEKNYQTFPLVYLELLSYYCSDLFPQSQDVDYSRFYTDDDLPKLNIKVKYYNNLDEQADNEIMIKFKPNQYIYDNDGSGKCTFKIMTENVIE